MPQKIVVAITGASGSIYAQRLLHHLLQMGPQVQEVGIVMSQNAKDVWRTELGNDDYASYPFRFYESMNFYAPFASGSAQFTTMFVTPCSMGTLGRIAAGISNDLLTRAADVMMKERRKLILTVRETPYNLIHLRNMQLVTEAGAIVCPATPSFYSRPTSFEAMADTVVLRMLDLAGLKVDGYRWGSEPSDL